MFATALKLFGVDLNRQFVRLKFTQRAATEIQQKVASVGITIGFP
jgi:hypothetical protein